MKTSGALRVFKASAKWRQGRRRILTEERRRQPDEEDFHCRFLPSSGLEDVRN